MTTEQTTPADTGADEKQSIEEALAAASGDVTAASVALGWTRKRLYSRMDLHDIDPATYRPEPVAKDPALAPVKGRLGRRPSQTPRGPDGLLRVGCAVDPVVVREFERVAEGEGASRVEAMSLLVEVTSSDPKLLVKLLRQGRAARLARSTPAPAVAA